MTRQVTVKVRDLTFRDFGRLVRVKGAACDFRGLSLPAEVHEGHLRKIWPHWEAGKVVRVYLDLSHNADYSMGGDAFDIVVEPDDEITVMVPTPVRLGEIA